MYRRHRLPFRLPFLPSDGRGSFQLWGRRAEDLHTQLPRRRFCRLEHQQLQPAIWSEIRHLRSICRGDASGVGAGWPFRFWDSGERRLRKRRRQSFYGGRRRGADQEEQMLRWWRQWPQMNLSHLHHNQPITSHLCPWRDKLLRLNVFESSPKNLL